MTILFLDPSRTLSKQSGWEMGSWLFAFLLCSVPITLLRSCHTQHVTHMQARLHVHVHTPFMSCLYTYMLRRQAHAHAPESLQRLVDKLRVSENRGQCSPLTIDFSCNAQCTRFSAMPN